MRISDWSSDVCSSDLPSRSKLPARIASGCSAARTGDLVLIEIRRSALKLRRVAIVCPVRTAVGKFGGGLSALTAGELGALILRALVARSGVDPERVVEIGRGSGRESVSKAG